MKVQNLLQFLRTLEEPLRSAGGTKVANELRDACKELEPFGDLAVTQFADFLCTADHYRKTGEAPATLTKAKSRAKVVDKEKVEMAAKTVTSLYEQAIDSRVDYSDVERELKRLNKELSKDEAVALAAAVNIAQPQRTKKAAFESIQARIFDGKQSFERTKF